MTNQGCLANHVLHHLMHLFSLDLNVQCKEIKQQYKAREVSNGSTRDGEAQILGHIYAATPDMADFCIFVALCALLGLFIFGIDILNTFAEAPASKQIYYMQVDD